MALGVVLGGVPRPVPAAPAPPGSPAPVSLRWRAPAGCPDQATMQATLVEALGSVGDDLQVDVVVTEPADGAFHAQVVMRGPWGESTRSLQSPTCDTLADAVTLLAVVSAQQAETALVVPEPVSEPEPESEPVAVDSRQAASETDTSSVEASDAEAAAGAPDGPQVPRAADVEPRPDAPSPWEGVARLATRAGAGILPGVDLSAALAVGVSRRHLRLELSGAGWLPRDRVVAADAAVRIHLVAGGLRGCAVLRPRPWLAVLPCADLEAGAMRGRGQGGGLAAGRTSWQPWVAAGLTPALSFRVHPRVSVWVGGSLVVPLSRPGFQLQGQPTEAYRVPAVSGRGALGVELHMPPLGGTRQKP